MHENVMFTRKSCHELPVRELLTVAQLTDVISNFVSTCQKMRRLDTCQVGSRQVLFFKKIIEISF